MWVARCITRYTLPYDPSAMYRITLNRYSTPRLSRVNTDVSLSSATGGVDTSDRSSLSYAKKLLSVIGALSHKLLVFLSSGETGAERESVVTRL